MHLTTLSQVLHYKLDCDQLELTPTELKTKGFTSYIETFLKPFSLKLKQKKVKVECAFYHDGRKYEDQNL